MQPAEALLENSAFQRTGTIGIVLDHGGLEHLHKRGRHTLADRRDAFDH